MAARVQREKAAREILTPKQTPPRPGIAPAHGLRAGWDPSMFRRPTERETIYVDLNLAPFLVPSVRATGPPTEFPAGLGDRGARRSMPHDCHAVDLEPVLGLCDHG